MTTENKDELTENEYPLAIKVFSVLRWVMVGCAVLTFVGGIVLLFKGYPWYFVIPGYLVLNIFFRVMKTYFRNIAEELQAAQDELGNQTF
jgi:hypothetical protein